MGPAIGQNIDIDVEDVDVDQHDDDDGEDEACLVEELSEGQGDLLTVQDIGISSFPTAAQAPRSCRP